MAKEIEKKWLVKYIPDIKPIEIRDYVFQGYLVSSKTLDVRISNRLNLTVKIGSGLTREEKIYPISQNEYDELLPRTVGKQIEKSRSWIPIHDGLVAEVDTYLNKNAGIQVVEVEFPSEEAALKFVPPDWFGEDVSDRLEYKNSLLAK